MSACVDCAKGNAIARGRCDRCYRRHLVALKREGAYSSRTGRAFRPAVDRVFERATPGADGCLIFTGEIDRQGYGRIHCISRRRERVHRIVHEALIGPIPTDWTVDHTCHNRDLTCPGGPTCIHRRCVNPQHLEAVETGENTRRAQLRVPILRTRCRRGHRYTPETTLWQSPERPGGNPRRRCRICLRISRNASARRIRAAARAAR